MTVKIKDVTSGYIKEIEALKAERDAAMREASELAMSIWRAEFQKLSPDFELCDSPAGVISQIDNMYAAIRGQRDALAARIQTAERVEKIFIETTELTFDDCLKLFADEIRDVQAEAGRAGFIAGANKWVAAVHPDYADDAIPDIEADASQYAATVRQGGAE